jgi:hypothetical protein
MELRIARRFDLGLLVVFTAVVNIEERLVRSEKLNLSCASFTEHQIIVNRSIGNVPSCSLWVGKLTM